jgi:hypothetical protein
MGVANLLPSQMCGRQLADQRGTRQSKSLDHSDRRNKATTGCDDGPFDAKIETYVASGFLRTTVGPAYDDEEIRTTACG